MTGENLRQAIKRAGLKLDEAAALFQISRQTLYINVNKSVLDPTFVAMAKKELAIVFKKKQPGDTSWETFFEDEHIEKNSTIKNLESRIEDQQKMIEMQNRLIEVLESQLKTYAPDVGKAGARRTSV